MWCCCTVRHVMLLHCVTCDVAALCDMWCCFTVWHAMYAGLWPVWYCAIVWRHLSTCCGELVVALCDMWYCRTVWHVMYAGLWPVWYCAIVWRRLSACCGERVVATYCWDTQILMHRSRTLSPYVMLHRFPILLRLSSTPRVQSGPDYAVCTMCMCAWGPTTLEAPPPGRRENCHWGKVAKSVTRMNEIRSSVLQWKNCGGTTFPVDIIWAMIVVWR